MFFHVEDFSRLARRTTNKNLIGRVHPYHQFVFVNVTNRSTSDRFEDFGNDDTRFEQKDVSFFAFFDDLFRIPDLKGILQQHIT